MSSFVEYRGFKKIDKYPSAVLDYQVDWTEWLDTDEIATSVFSATLGITVNTQLHDLSKTTVWLAGGTHGVLYLVNNTITTTQGRTETKSFYVQVTTAASK